MAAQPKVFAIDRGLGKYNIIDHYAVMGLPLTVAPDQIRGKFLSLAKALHPDTFEGNDQERLLASMFFARMISPAYQILSNSRLRGEYFATLKLLIQNLKKKEEVIKITSQVAQKLQQTYHESFYPKYVEEASVEQYLQIDRVLERMGDISELNLIYLLTQDSGTPVAKKEVLTSSSSPKDVNETIRRDLQLAELYIGKKQWTDALKELKAAEKKAPENPTLHCLMGIVYFHQGALPLARACLQKALKQNPQYEEAQKYLKEVDKKMTIPKKEEKKGWFGIGKK